MCFGQNSFTSEGACYYSLCACTSQVKCREYEFFFKASVLLFSLKETFMFSLYVRIYIDSAEFSFKIESDDAGYF